MGRTQNQMSGDISTRRTRRSPGPEGVGGGGGGVGGQHLGQHMMNRLRGIHSLLVGVCAWHKNGH